MPERWDVNATERLVNDKRCIFCGSIEAMTAEHPMSKRVLDLAGFGLNDYVLELDVPLNELTAQHVAERMVTIGDQVVRCVCAICNNGWMQNVDHSFASTIEGWVRNPTHRLGHGGLDVVTRFLLKVMWVRILGEQWAAGPIEGGEVVSDVILNPKHGESIRTGDISELTSQLSVGGAAVEADSIFTHAAFTPRVDGQPERSGLRRFSAGLVVALPPLRLQLWLVYRFTSSMSTSWPTRVTWLGSGSRYGQLSIAPSQPRLDDVYLAMT